MTSPDTRTRALERDLDPEAAGALLRERIRAGEVPERHVRLAAWLGYPPALAAAEPLVPDEDRLLERQRFAACRVIACGAMDKPRMLALLAWLEGRMVERGEVEWNGDGGYYWVQARSILRDIRHGVSCAEDVSQAVGRHMHALGSLREKPVVTRKVAKVLCWGPPS
tara:strand:- start:29163 stop:29663 length:501 start_codon:yes stop_codon:yes gene_type:complete